MTGERVRGGGAFLPRLLLLLSETLLPHTAHQFPLGQVIYRVHEREHRAGTRKQGRRCRLVLARLAAQGKVFYFEGKAQLTSAAVGTFAYVPSIRRLLLFHFVILLGPHLHRATSRIHLPVDFLYVGIAGAYVSVALGSVPRGEISFDIQPEPPLSEPTQNIKDRPAGQNPGERTGLADAVGRIDALFIQGQGIGAFWGFSGRQGSACMLEIFPAPSKPGPLL